MKSRIITGAVAGGLALVLLLFLPPLALNIAMSVICAMAIWEILAATKYIDHRGLMAAAVVVSALMPFLILNPYPQLTAFLLALYVIFLGVVQIIYHDTLKVERTGFVFFVSLVVPLSLSCLAYCRNYFPRHGLFYVFLTLVMPWCCDIGAYFIGTFFGKHKLCPKISPKKTVEGVAGGIVVSVAASLLTALIYQLTALKGTGLQVSYWQIAVVAVALAPLSVAGDLFASIIKRQCSVKDFGKIMPGHGGIMDRFDSLLFVAPLLFLLFQFLPLVY